MIRVKTIWRSLIKSIIIFLLLFSPVLGQEKIAPICGLKWNMSFDHVKEVISAGQAIPLIKCNKRSIKYPPEYCSSLIIGKFFGISCKISCDFSFDSLYAINISNEAISFGNDSNLSVQILGSDIFLRLSNALIVDTFKIDNYSSIDEKSVIYGYDSSSIEYTKSRYLDDSTNSYRDHGGYLEFRSPKYYKIKDDLDNYRNIHKNDLSLINGFLDIRFGESKINAKALMAKRSDTKLTKAEKDCLYYSGGTFGGQKVLEFLLLFNKDKFYSGIVILNEISEIDLLDTYDRIKDIVSQKYGLPDEDIKEFKVPYYYGDGYEKQALQLGKAQIYSKWVFENNNSDDDIIICNISSEGLISILYCYGTLAKEYYKEKEKQELRDF
jgi:hypothetical protein